MVLIHVPRPKDAYNPDRPMGSLLKAQIEHLREAESKLPLRYRLEIETYVKAVRTEGEAASYIRAVTDAIHRAHEDARSARAPKKRAGERKRVIEIAAVADERAEREQKNARKRRAATSKKRGARKSRKK
ncbi:MAG TPA: hypothetical protein VMS18_13695 [Candidatus Binatia bacterium]|nr:hypothetical protein [Candidatus Binatia bacterium]